MTPRGVSSVHEGNVQSVAADPQGRWFASGSWDRTIRVWDVERREEIGRGGTGVVFRVFVVSGLNVPSLTCATRAALVAHGFAV